MGDGDGGSKHEGHATLTATEQPATSATPAAELAPATLIGRYEIERKLGAGGMGVVYAAYDIHLRRTVALKLVGPRIDAASGQDHLVHEAQAMAKLRHPNLATVHDIGISGDRLFIVMELVDGGTLVDWLQAKPRSWREIVAMYLQAARGLAAVHAAGFVHRDFKPENVLIGTDGVARVSDFGVARLLAAEHADAGDDAKASSVVGTVGYMAPEIVRGHPVDHHADQFSFCVALHTSIHGERPFAPLAGRGRLEETLGPLRPPSRAIAPRWLRTIINRGLAADPRDRWPTMAALAAALERRSIRRPSVRVLMGGGGVVTALVLVRSLATRPTPTHDPEWSPVAIARDDTPSALTVSRDGSTFATLSMTDAWVEPRAGTGPRRHLTYPVSGSPINCKLSRRGDQLACVFDVGAAGLEIWAIEVATGHADRRVPPRSAPALKPWHVFDIGPDGSILFSAADLSAVWRVDQRGAVTRVIAADAGERLIGPMWSPDGTRIAVKARSSQGIRIQIVNPSTRAATVVSRRFCKELQWLSNTSLLCTPLVFRRPVVIELQLPSGGGEARERVRYQGPEYQLLTSFVASDAGLLLSTLPIEQHLALLALDGRQPIQPIASSGIVDLPPAGWTSSGALIFGANVRGRLRIMAARPDGTIETVHAATAAEVPLAVLGDTILFGRFPGGETTIPFFEAPIGRRYPDGELFQLAYPDGSPRSLGSTRGFHALLCAAASKTCLLGERIGGDVAVIDWDPTTGARGRLRARWSISDFPGIPTVSSDGTTLVHSRTINRRNVVSFLDLDSGRWRDVPTAPWRGIYGPSWQPDGTLVALATADDASRWIVRIRDATSIERITPAPSMMEDDEFRVSPDGKTAAILTSRPLSHMHWWISRSPE